MSLDLYLTPDKAIAYLENEDLASLSLSVFGEDIRIQKFSTFAIFKTFLRSNFEAAAKLLIARAVVTESESYQKFIAKIEDFAKQSFGQASLETLREHEKLILQQLTERQKAHEEMQRSTEEKLQKLFDEALNYTVSLSEAESVFLDSCCNQFPAIIKRAAWVNEQSLKLRQEIKDCSALFLQDCSELCKKSPPSIHLILELNKLTIMASIHVSRGWKKQADIYLPTLNFLKKAIEQKNLLEERMLELTKMMMSEIKLRDYLTELTETFSDERLEKEFAHAGTKKIDQNPDDNPTASWEEFNEAPLSIKKAIRSLIGNFRLIDKEIIQKFKTKHAELSVAIQQLKTIWENALEQALADGSLNDMSPGSEYEREMQIKYNTLNDNILTMNKSPVSLMRKAYEEIIQKIKETQP